MRRQKMENLYNESVSAETITEVIGGDELISNLEKENAELKSKIMYLNADIDNIRKRTEKRISEVTINANETLIKELLPVIDDMERMLTSLTNADDLIGATMIKNKLDDILAKNGLTKIDANGFFDVNFHEAIAFVNGYGVNGSIVECTQNGYILNGKVIRYAKVVVASNA